MTRGHATGLILVSLSLLALVALSGCGGERAPRYGAPSPGAPTESVGRTPEEGAYPGAPAASGSLASPSPTSAPLPTSTATPPAATEGPGAPTPATGGGVTVELTATNFSFSRSRLEVARGAQVVLRFRNEDGVAHNFALYANAQAQEGLFSSPAVGPRSSGEFTFVAPDRPGEYFFRCNFHPDFMTGVLAVR